MQKNIVPHLWFATQAKEATAWYTSLFPQSKITNIATLHNTPSGDSDIVSFELLGQPFMAISAGPYFTFNPSVSLMVNFDPSQDSDAVSKIDTIWNALVDGGKVLMPLQEYPFSKRYGWVQDKYGLSWQLILTNPEGEPRPLVLPSLLFVGDMAGKAEEATDFYLSVFKESRRGMISRYPAGMEPDKEGGVMFTDYQLSDTWFAAMDSAQKHAFPGFNEAISFIVKCDTQEEIDYYWEKLSAVPEAEQCGWLKDKYGLSWQIAPTAMDDMMKADQATVDRVTQAFLKMKKFDIATLERAAKGE